MSKEDTSQNESALTSDADVAYTYFETTTLNDASWAIIAQHIALAQDKCRVGLFTNAELADLRHLAERVEIHRKSFSERGIASVSLDAYPETTDGVHYTAQYAERLYTGPFTWLRVRILPNRSRHDTTVELARFVRGSRYRSEGIHLHATFADPRGDEEELSTLELLRSVASDFQQRNFGSSTGSSLGFSPNPRATDLEGWLNRIVSRPRGPTLSVLWR